MSSQKGVVHVFLLLILLAGLGAGLWLVQTKTNFLPKAFLSNPVTPQTSFSLTSAQTNYKVSNGQEISVQVIAHSDIDAANLFTARFSFDKDVLYVRGIDTGSSFVKNWVEQTYDNNTGKISLVGGVPNPGIVTNPNDKPVMATILFTAKKSGSVTFFWDVPKSAIYRNLDNVNILGPAYNLVMSVTVGNGGDTGQEPVSVDNGTPSPVLTGSYLVKPYLVYPADKPIYPEYETAVRNYMSELQNWYKDKVGVTFKVAPLQVIRSSENYLNMRCGSSPSQKCLNDPSVLEGNWGASMNKAIHHGVESWDEKTATLVFGAGGGGYAGSNKYPNDTGWAITGDWVLEPISGKANDWGIPCKYSHGWECSGGVPKGSPAHELGHAFGLPHPDPFLYPGDHVSIMRWHGDYPTVGFLPHEVQFLRSSPFFTQGSTVPTANQAAINTSNLGLTDLSGLLSDFNKTSGYKTTSDLNLDKTVNTPDFSLMRNALIQNGVVKGN